MKLFDFLKDAKDLFAKARLALLGQFLALVTTFIPVVFGQIDSLPNLILAASIATILTPALTLASSVLVPTMSTSELAARASEVFKALLIALCLSVLLLASVASSNQVWLLVSLALPFAAVQAFYALSVALLVRLGDHSSITLSRFLNNLISFAMTLFVALTGGSWAGFILAAAAGFISPIFMLRRNHEFGQVLSSAFRLFMHTSLKLRSLWSSFRRNGRTIFVATISTLWSQVPYAMTPLMGPLVNAWALTSRFSSGVETLAGNVIGSLLDIERAKAIRENNVLAKTRMRRLSMALGLALGLLVGFAAVATGDLVGVINLSNATGWFAGFMLIALVTTQALSAINSQYLMLLGGVGQKFALDSFKATALFLPVVILTSDAEAITVTSGLIIWAVLQYLAIFTLTSQSARRSFGQRLKALANSNFFSWQYLAFDWVLTFVAIALVKFAQIKPKRQTLLLAASSFSNIGDQALLKGALAGIGSNVHVILTSIEESKKTTEWLPNRSLISGMFSYNPFVSACAFIKTAKLIAGSEYFAIIGADGVDGLYTTQQSIRRIMLLRTASQLKVSNALLGFSWGKGIKAPVERSVELLSEDSLMVVRDPESFKRFAAISSLAKKLQGADLAFSLEQTNDISPEHLWIEAQRLAKRQILGLNLNGSHLYFAKVHEAYRQLVTDFIQMGWSVLLISHDSRTNVSDNLANEKLAANFETDFVRVADGIANPGEVRATVRELDFVVSGRMHLAILSLIECTPVVTISEPNLDKVAGLYELVGLPELVVPLSDAGMQTLANVLSRFESQNGRWRQQIQSSIGRLIELSTLNFLRAPKN